MFDLVLRQFGALCRPGDSTNNFFSLTPWYEYLEGETDAFGKCIPQVKLTESNDIWLILLAVIDSLLKIAALVAVGFVIYGGIQFVISQGEPDKTNAARNTIINALVGLVIAIIAAGLISFIGTRISS